MNLQPLPTNLRKAIALLARTKQRNEMGLFMAQGSKCVTDTLAHFNCRYLLATAQWFQSNPGIIPLETQAFIATNADLHHITTLQTTPPVIAIYQTPQVQLDINLLTHSDIILALDRIQDPGNLGTIVRLCAWMGVTQIIASPDTADIYNPKTVQASMGAISSVHVHYAPLEPLLNSLALKGHAICGTYLKGDNIYAAKLPDKAVIVMGNEGQGISAPVTQQVTHPLTIPPFPQGSQPAESLNVAVATAITLAQFRRTQFI